jgi:hypothetical protein
MKRVGGYEWVFWLIIADIIVWIAAIIIYRILTFYA